MFICFSIIGCWWMCFNIFIACLSGWVLFACWVVLVVTFNVAWLGGCVRFVWLMAK